MKEGDIYLLRDRDLRVTPPVQSAYLKIGIAEDTPARVKQHQTGNPRQIEVTYQQLVPGKSQLEKFLHHYFSTDRTRGEWFWIDETREASDLMPVLTTHHNEQIDHQANLVAIDVLKTTQDNGNVRAPSTTEQNISTELQQAEELLKLAKAQHDIHDYNLRALINTGNGIEGVITLNRKASPDTFDKTGFIASLSSAEFLQCHSSGTEFVSTPSFLHTTRSLRTINPALNTAKGAAKALAPTGSLPVSNLGNPAVLRSSSIESEHHDWLETRRDIAIHKWTVEQKKAELKALIGDDQEITGVLRWVRGNQPFTDKWSLSDAKENLPTEYQSFCTPNSDIAAVKIHEGKPYP